MSTNLPKLTTSTDVLESIINAQVHPSDERIEINDKFAKVFFRRNYNATKNYQLVEKKASKKGTGNKKNSREVITQYRVSSDNGNEIISLSEFERAVLAAIISEQKKGNKYTTINIIFRSLVGKVGKADAGIYPSKNQKAAIENAIQKLMSTIVNFKDLDKSFKALGYCVDEEPIQIKEGPILPAVLLDCKINGQFVEDVVYFTLKSPLLERAEKMNQIVRYPVNILDVPNQKNTPLIIALKTYVLRRIVEIKLHKQLTPTITFDDVFKKCRLDGANRHKKFDARNAILQLFAHLKNLAFISDFDTLKRGVSVYGICFKK